MKTQLGMKKQIDDRFAANSVVNEIEPWREEDNQSLMSQEETLIGKTIYGKGIKLD